MMPEDNEHITAAQARAARYEMHKSVETKEDGRLLIYYTFMGKNADGQQQKALAEKTKKKKGQEVCQ
jgi:hypothetical protein